MNKTIIENWNKKVGKTDIVYFLGDMAFGRGSRKTSYWLKELNGKIIFIKGSHDKSRRIEFLNRLILNSEADFNISPPAAHNTAYTLRAGALALRDTALFGRNVVYAGAVSRNCPCQ